MAKPHIPNEILTQIAEYLPLKDLASFAKVSKNFHKISSNLFYKHIKIPFEDDWMRISHDPKELTSPQLLFALRNPDIVKSMRLNLEVGMIHIWYLVGGKGTIYSGARRWKPRDHTPRLSMITPFERLTALELSGLQKLTWRGFHRVLIHMFETMPQLTVLKIHFEGRAWCTRRGTPTANPDHFEISSIMGRTGNLKSLTIFDHYPCEPSIRDYFYHEHKSEDASLLEVLASSAIQEGISKITFLELLTRKDLQYLFRGVKKEGCDQKLSLHSLKELKLSIEWLEQLRDLPFTEATFLNIQKLSLNYQGNFCEFGDVRHLVFPVCMDLWTVTDNDKYYHQISKFPQLRHLCITQVGVTAAIDRIQAWAAISGTLFRDPDLLSLRIMDFQLIGYADEILRYHLATVRHFRQYPPSWMAVPETDWDLLPPVAWYRDVFNGPASGSEIPDTRIPFSILRRSNVEFHGLLRGLESSVIYRNLTPEFCDI